MKHFLIELTYSAPIEKIDEAVQAHRAYLQVGYDSGMLLCSGPQNPKTGGIIIGRAESKEAIELFFNQDPFQKQGLAIYRFVEFNPVKHQSFLASWVQGS